MNNLGDNHNFGKRVTKDGQWVRKPRTIYWEWLFLCADSFLREFFSKCDDNPFSRFPNLAFCFLNNSLFPYEGKVEYVADEPTPEKVDLHQTSIGLGNLIAISSYFGIADLHLENIYPLLTEDHEVAGAYPIDVEVIFESMDFGAQTYLLDSKKNHNKITGIVFFKKLEINVAAVIHGFVCSIKTLNSKTSALLDCFEKENIEKIPIRKLIKPTSYYASYLKGQKGKAEFLTEELEQLKRGDIPYFYTYLGDAGLYYLSKNGVQRSETIWDRSQSRSIMSPSKGNCIKIIQDLFIKHTVLQIARSFCSTGNESYHFDGTDVRIVKKQIYVVTNGWKLSCMVIS